MEKHKDKEEISANQERVNFKLSKRKKEIAEKINSKRFPPDIKLIFKLEGEALQLLQIQTDYIGILSSYKFKIFKKSSFNEEFSIDVKKIDPEWDIEEVFETQNNNLIFKSPCFLYLYSLKNENNKFNMKFIKKKDIPLNKTIMTLYNNNSFIIANQENGKLSIINSDTLKKKKEIKTNIENIEFVFYIKEEKLLIINSNKGLHIYKEEKEIKIIEDCFAASITYDDGFLVCGFQNIISIINVKDFSIEKNYKGFVRDENNCDDIIEGFNEEKNKEFYGYGDEIRNIIKVNNNYWFLCSNETPDPCSESAGIICLLDKDFNVVKEYRQFVGYFGDALKITDNTISIPANDMLINVEIFT